MKNFWFQLSSNDELCKAQIKIMKDTFTDLHNYNESSFDCEDIKGGNRAIVIRNYRWHHNIFDSDKKRLLQYTFEEAIEELKKGEELKIEVDKYYLDDDKKMIRIMRKIGVNEYKYLPFGGQDVITGFDEGSDYAKSLVPLNTKEEIEKHLKTLGQKYIGKKIIIMVGRIKGQCSYSKLGNTFIYNKEEDELILKSNSGEYTIYRQGDWAEIIPDEFKIKGVDELTIGKSITADGQEYTRKQVKLVSKLPYFHAIIFNKCDGSVVTVMKSDIDQLLKRMEK